MLAATYGECWSSLRYNSRKMEPGPVTDQLPCKAHMFTGTCYCYSPREVSTQLTSFWHKVVWT